MMTETLAEWQARLDRQQRALRIITEHHDNSDTLTNAQLKDVGISSDDVAILVATEHVEMVDYVHYVTFIPTKEGRDLLALADAMARLTIDDIATVIDDIVRKGDSA
jgi:uncharacterized protein YciW